jgi:hypothetical protein
MTNFSLAVGLETHLRHQLAGRRLNLAPCAASSSAPACVPPEPRPHHQGSRGFVDGRIRRWFASFVFAVIIANVLPGKYPAYNRHQLIDDHSRADRNVRSADSCQ